MSSCTTSCNKQLNNFKVLLYLVHFLTTRVNLLPIHIFNNFLLIDLLPRRRLPVTNQTKVFELTKWFGL